MLSIAELRGEMEETIEKMRRDFGNWIRERLDKAGLKHLNIAKEIGITPQQLSRILGGTSGTKPTIVVALAQKAGADPREALERAGYSRRLLGPDLLQRVMDEVALLSPETQKDVLDFAKAWRRREQESEPETALNHKNARGFMVVSESTKPEGPESPSASEKESA